MLPVDYCCFKAGKAHIFQLCLLQASSKIKKAVKANVKCLMKYKYLGKTGLQVSAIALGMMSYGDSNWRDWVKTEAEAKPIVKRAVEAGINFFDTADMYSLGQSEEITGRLLKEFTRRDETVIATKVFFKMTDKPNRGGLGRKHIFDSVFDSLQRLGTDYIDLYQIHRWDYNTPIEETLEALHDVVKAGWVRYIGASSMAAYQFTKALYKADLAKQSRFVSMQNHYNLLYREEEREMLPLCAEEGIGVIPWSPLARGHLTRPFAARLTTVRAKSDKKAESIYDFPEAEMIISEVVNISKEKAVKPAQIALAWLLHKPEVTAPIVGATKLSYLEDALSSLEISLSENDLDRLEQYYPARPVLGY